MPAPFLIYTSYKLFVTSDLRSGSCRVIQWENNPVSSLLPISVVTHEHLIFKQPVNMDSSAAGWWEYEGQECVGKASYRSSLAPLFGLRRFKIILVQLRIKIPDSQSRCTIEPHNQMIFFPPLKCLTWLLTRVRCDRLMSRQCSQRDLKKQTRALTGFNLRVKNKWK